MKEQFNNEVKLSLTNLPPTPYSGSGEIFMVEPGQGEGGRPMGTDEATRRLEEAARQGQQRRPEEPSQGARQEPAAEAGGPGGRDREPPAPPVGGPEEQPQEPRDGQQGENAQEGRETLDSMLRSLRRRIVDHDQHRRGDIGEGDRLMDEVRELVGQFPVVEAAGIPHELLEIASYFRETREELINRILFKAYQDPTETNSYQESMNLYAQSNLDTLLGYLSRQDPTRHEYFVGLRTAASLFHTMNATLTGGNLEEFLSISERINYQHFGLMRDIRGAPEVMRLYEQKYNEFLARERRISTEGYEALRREVEQALRLENESSLIRSEYENERTGDNVGRLKEWELQRALNVGRTFFNITFRASEKIATGQVPRSEEEGGTEGHKRFASFPQESAVRIMNWMQWLTYRFDVAGSRGGQEFLKRVKNKYAGFLEQKRRHLGINKLLLFGGMRTDEAEVGAMFGVSGIYSSWRLENMAFAQIRIRINGQETTIREWLDERYNPDAPEQERVSRSTRIDQIRRQASDLIKTYGRKGKLDQNEEFRSRMERVQDELLNFLSPLLDSTNVGLGILLKHGIFSEEVGYKVRERIWEKVAQNNIPLMIDYLSKVQFNGETRENMSQLAFDNIVRSDSSSWTEEALARFKNKVLLHHESRIKQTAGLDVSGAQLDDFTVDEQRLIQKIQESGRQLAPHLADIVFPYVPFMNDVPFELLDYRGPGNEFYKRRTASDLGSYFKAEGVFVTIMTNPGGLGHEETLKQFDAIVKGIESPNGATDAQERVFPMFDSWLEWIETKPGERQLLFKLGKQTLRKPTSLAQDYSDMEAESITESQERKILETSVRIGILDRELAEEMKKKKGLGFLGILWETFRDYFWVPFATGAFEFGKQTSKQK